MSFLRYVSLVLALALLPSLAHAATGDSPNQGGQGCKLSFLSQPVLNQSVLSQPVLNQSVLNQSVLNQSVDMPEAFTQPAPKPVSTFCEQFYCPGTAPVVQCLCACDAEECVCSEECAPGDFRCPQRCRNELNNCYVGCQEL